MVIWSCQQEMNFFDINEFKQQIKQGKRLLCIDVGMSKIGLALSDTIHISASPYLLINQKKQKFTSKLIKDIIEEENVLGLVVGYPLQMDGNKGKSCEMVEKFVNKYLMPLSQPIFLQDERLSTSAAMKYLKEMDLNRKKQEAINDKAAASYILQTTLERLRLVK